MSAQPRRSGLRAPRGGRGNGNNNNGGGNNNNNNNNAPPPPHAGMYSAANVNYMTRHSPSDGKYAGPCIKPFQEGTLKFTKDFQQFSHQANLHFKEARFYDLHNIYTGVEKRPVLLPGEPQEDYEFREQCYDERVTLVLSCFQALSCINLYTYQGAW